MKKFNKTQLNAIEKLVYDIDELQNKPRRLFYALEEFAFAFQKKDAVPSIREAQDLVYSHINEGSHYAELFDTLREFKVEEWKNQIENSPDDIGKSENRIRSAEDFIKLHINRLTKMRF